MALTFEELILESVQANRTADGVVSTVRRFKVPGQTPEDALADPSLNGAPPTGAAIGSLHPRNPSGEDLRCSGYRLGDRIGNGENAGYYVYAEYVPGGVPSLGGPPPDVTNPNYLVRTSSTARGELPYPVIRRVQTPVPQPAVGGVVQPPLIGFKFPVEWKTRGMVVSKFQITCNLDHWNIADIATVAAQTDKVHTFSGAKWCYEGADANEIYQANLFTITHRWYAEAPTLQKHWGQWWDTGANSWSTDPTVPIEIPYRPPFARFETGWVSLALPFIPPGYDASVKIIPFVEAVQQKEEVPTGYTTLPGYRPEWLL